MRIAGLSFVLATSFEAAAECDVDGDGDTSLYAVSGTIDAKTRRLELTKEVFVDEDGE
jgi:hypothetical protein